jgi:RNA polymerase sigma-70 factor (ECF subfamily)
MTGRIPLPSSGLTLEDVLPEVNGISTVQPLAAYVEQGLRYAMAMLRNEGDAEEAVQEVICRLHNAARLTEVEPVTAPRAVFFAALRNQCIDVLRRRQVRREVSVDDWNQFETSDSPAAESQGDGEFSSLIERLLANMPEHWSDVLKLKINAGLSYAEIAEIRDCTVHQVRSWIYRSRRWLETELRRSGHIF